MGILICKNFKNLKVFLSLFLVLTFFNSSFAAKTPHRKNSQNKISSIQKRIANQKKIISSTAKEITDLEKNLNIGNKRYLSTIKKRKNLETLLFEINSNSQQTVLNLQIKIKNIRKAVRGIVVNS